MHEWERERWLEKYPSEGERIWGEEADRLRASVEAAVSARARVEERERVEQSDRKFFIRFDGPPAHDSGRFVEVETADGLSVSPEASGARWYLQDDGTWLLGPFGYAAAPVEGGD